MFGKLSKTKLKEAREIFITSKRLLGLLWHFDKAIFLGLIVSLSIQAIIPFINAYIYKLIIDLIVEGTRHKFSFNTFYILLGARTVTLAASAIATSVQTYMDMLMWTRIPVFLYQKVLSKLTTLDVEYFENDKFKDMLQRVKEGYSWRPLNMYSNIFYTFQSILQLIIAFAALAILNVALAFGIILASLPAFIHQLYFTKTRWGVWSENSPYRKRFWYLSELIQERQGIKEMKVFGTAKKFLSDITTMQNKFARENISVGKRMLRSSVILDFFGTAIYVAIEAFVILLTISGRITIGSLSYFTAVILNFQNGVNGFFRNIGQLFEHNLYVRDMITVLDISDNIKNKTRAIKISRNKPPRIEFRNVTFAYPGTKNTILKNFSLEIEPGDKIAFVGENGAGKTTIIKLLARFYDVTSGEILINGTNIKDVDLVSWYQSLGVIFQDFIKYEYTLSENIHFGKIYKPLDQKEMVAAAQFAGADKIAQNLPRGYKQMLGKTFEEGEELSLGQWQKVALARAFLRDAPILILDEPTSSLDAKAEKKIFDKVDKLGREKSVITISHRFSTVRNADKIYVIERGKIVEAGNHRELISKKGTYAKLFNIQAARYK